LTPWEAVAPCIYLSMFNKVPLGGILGLGGVARDHERRAESQRLVLAHQALVRRDVPVPRPLGEPLMIRGDGRPSRPFSTSTTTPGAKRFPAP